MIRSARCAAALVFAGASLVFLAGSVRAQEATPSEAVTYLEKVAAAGGATYQARHLIVYFGEPQSAAVVDVRSSRDGHFVRAESGDTVKRLWRRDDLGLVSDGYESISDAAPPVVALRPHSVMAKYDVAVEDPEMILGTEVVPLLLVRRADRARVERMWVHPDSGVVYRRELYGDGGELVGMSTILDMKWGTRGEVEAFEPSGRTPARVKVSARARAPEMLPHGYRLVRCYKVSLEGNPSDHWVYSDGLHTLSVFRTAGSLRAPAGFTPVRVGEDKAWAGPGPGTWAWEGDGSAWVVVAEEPALDADRLTSAFPRGGPSIWARLGSIWSRLFRGIGSAFG